MGDGDFRDQQQDERSAMNRIRNPEPAPMILLRLRPAALARPIYMHTHLHLAPKLHLTAVHSFAHLEMLRVERVRETAGGERMAWREELVRRIFEVGARRDGGTQPAAGPGALPGSLQFSQKPMPAVLLRPAARAAQVEIPAAPLSAAHNQPVPPAVQALPLDLQKLSDQIVQNIDRRLQAHRERLG